MKWLFLVTVLFSSIVLADFTKSTFFIEIDTVKNESVQYYDLVGDDFANINMLKHKDFLMLSGRHLLKEESLRNYGMCPQDYTPLVFFADVEYVHIYSESVVFFIGYYARCFHSSDLTNHESQSGILQLKD
jgi:hypothetical protein